MNSVFDCGLVVHDVVSCCWPVAGRVASLGRQSGREVVMNHWPDEVPADIHRFSQPDTEPTPWSVGSKEIGAADTFWLSVVRRVGRPHVYAVGRRVARCAIWFCTGPEERKAKNLVANPSCILTTGSATSPTARSTWFLTAGLCG